MLDMSAHSVYAETKGKTIDQKGGAGWLRIDGIFELPGKERAFYRTGKFPRPFDCAFHALFAVRQSVYAETKGKTIDQKGGAGWLVIRQ